MVIQAVLKPKLKAFKNMNFSQFISTTFPNNSTQYTYDPDTGELSIKIEYSQDIQDKIGEIIFDPTLSGSVLFTPSSTNHLSLKMDPDNN